MKTPFLSSSSSASLRSSGYGGRGANRSALAASRLNRSSSSSPARHSFSDGRLSKKAKGYRQNTRRAARSSPNAILDGRGANLDGRGANRLAASDLVSLVLERSLVFGCGSVNNVNTSQPESPFPACVAAQRLIKQTVAATGLRCRDDCFFNAVHRMNEVNFTRREIVEEVSPRLTIHPSIERTVSSHE